MFRATHTHSVELLIELFMSEEGSEAQGCYRLAEADGELIVSHPKD